MNETRPELRLRQGLLVGFTMALATAVGTARAELVGHWTLDNDTTGLTNLGSNGATSDLGIMGSLSPTFNATGGYDGGGYATFGVGAALVSVAPENAAANISASGGYPFSFSAWARSPVPPWTNFPRGTIMALSTPTVSGDFIQMSVGYGEDLDFEANRRLGGATNLIDAQGTGATVTDGNWHHLAAVFPDPSTLILYVDGVPQTLSVDPITTVNYPATISAIGIGAFRRSNTLVQDAMRGDIDDPRLFNHALSLAEVQDLAGVIPGDFNRDGSVDGVDFVAWQTNFPLAAGATLVQGDADGDGDVDGADFVVWQTNFPYSPPSPGSSSIPEPHSLVLALMAVIGTVWTSRKRAATAVA